MRSVEVNSKLLGEKIGKDIYSETGRLLLGKGVVLTEPLIFKLVSNNIYFIYIDDEMSEGIEIKGIIDDHKMIKSVLKVKSVLSNIMEKKNNGIETIVPEKHIEYVKDVIKLLIESLEESNDALYTVVNLMGTDMYTYKHSVNVAILTILTCNSLGYTYELTKKIALGALLHDIGKSVIGEELINKKGELTDKELETIFTHPEEGYNLIKNDISLSGYTKQIVRLHHEKRDGSGYPLNLEEDKIPEFVRIVTICDMFDAITTDRSYRQKMPVHEAIEILMADSIFKLDAKILKVFLKNICVYPPGVGVQLTDDSHGIVVKYNKANPTRPVVRVFRHDSNENVEVEELDLEVIRTLFIDKIVDTSMIKEKYDEFEKNI